MYSLNYAEIALALNGLLPIFGSMETYLMGFGGSVLGALLRAIGQRVENLPKHIGQQLYDFVS